MLFTIATDGKRVTVATDTVLYGKACLSVEDEGVFDLKVGIGAAIMNMYLALPDKPKISLDGFPAYYMVFVDPFQLIELVASGVRSHEGFVWKRPMIAEEWGKRLTIEIVSKTSSLEDVQADRKKLDDDSWYIQYDPKELM